MRNPTYRHQLAKSSPTIVRTSRTQPYEQLCESQNVHMTKLKKMKLSKTPLIICVLMLSSAAFSQNLPANGIYHYLKTDDGVNLYVLDLGNRNAENTYIVLHGGFGAEHSYLVRPLLPHTAKNRFILFDQRGSLRSPAADNLLTFQNFVYDIEHIRKEFGLSKVNILAHSNGTTIALDYLHQHPDKVSKLILIGVPLSILDGKYFQGLDSPINKYKTELEIWQTGVNKKIEAKKQVYNLKDGENLTGSRSTLLQKILYSANHTYLMNDIEGSQNAFFNPDVFAALQKNAKGDELSKRTSRMSEALAKSSIPIFMINGEHDFVDPAGHVWPVVSEQVKQMKYFKIKNAGHNTWLDQPKEFNKVLKAALN